jgi:hypothetical protein
VRPAAHPAADEGLPDRGSDGPLPNGHTVLSDPCPHHVAGSGRHHRGAVFWRLGLPKLARPGEPPPVPRLGFQPLTPWTFATIVKADAAETGFGPKDFGGHSLKRGGLTTGMDRGEHPAKLKLLGRHMSFDVLGEYLEFGDLFVAVAGWVAIFSEACLRPRDPRSG